MLRAADLVDALGQENNPEWKTVAFNTNGEMVAPNGSIGFRWGEKGKWNLEQRDGKTGEETELQLSLLGSQDEIAEVGFLQTFSFVSILNLFYYGSFLSASKKKECIL